MRKEHLKLTADEHRSLTALTSSGQLKARQFKRAMTLLLLNEGKPMTEVSKTLKFSYPRVLALRNNYLENGLQCLEEQPRTGRPVVFDGDERAKITALACSNAPEGHANWSLRLLADRLVELEICRSISHTQVKKILKKTNSSRT
jgi:transposase